MSFLAPGPVITAADTNGVPSCHINRPYLHTQTHVHSPSLNIDKQVIGSIQTEPDGRTDGQRLERGGGSWGVGGMCVYRRLVNATAGSLTSDACGQFQCCNG
jgi:hypothetical protein